MVCIIDSTVALGPLARIKLLGHNKSTLYLNVVQLPYYEWQDYSIQHKIDARDRILLKKTVFLFHLLYAKGTLLGGLTRVDAKYVETRTVMCPPIETDKARPSEAYYSPASRLYFVSWPSDGLSTLERLWPGHLFKNRLNLGDSVRMPLLESPSSKAVHYRICVTSNHQMDPFSG